MDAKPTTYRRTQFKSRLEARWAVFLDHYFQCDNWEYEGKEIHLPKKGWSYTPDFLISLAHRTIVLEIKPARPSQDYIEQCKLFQAKIKHPIFICYGGFFNACPLVLTDLNKPTPQALTTVPWFISCEQALQTAQRYRFDLEHPEHIPPSKRGSAEQLKAFMQESIKPSKPRKKR